MSSQTSSPYVLRLGLVAALAMSAVALAGRRSAGVPTSRPYAPIGAETRTGESRVIGSMPPGVRESSGVAVSRQVEDVLWTHNDSGGQPRLFAVSHAGDLLATYRLATVRAIDWEDIALGRCPTVAGPGALEDSAATEEDTSTRAANAESGDCLYVADIGDNEAARPGVTIHVVREPRVRGTGVGRPEDGAEPELPVLLSRSFRYPDGPTDAEALAVAPNGDVLIVSKGEDGSVRLYRIGARQLETGANPIAEQLATLPIRVEGRSDRITGGTYRVDGRVMAIRSHREVYLFDEGSWDRPPRICPIAEEQAQGEGIDFYTEDSFILTTEARGDRSPIVVVSCPTD